MRCNMRVFILILAVVSPVFAGTPYLACRVDASGTVLEWNTATDADDPVACVGALGEGERAVLVPGTDLVEDPDAKRHGVKTFRVTAGRLVRRADADIARDKAKARKREARAAIREAAAAHANAKALLDASPDDADLRADVRELKIALDKAQKEIE